MADLPQLLWLTEVLQRGDTAEDFVPNDCLLVCLLLRRIPFATHVFRNGSSCCVARRSSKTIPSFPIQGRHVFI